MALAASDLTVPSACTKVKAALAALGALYLTAMFNAVAQVGYLNLQLYAGDNLIACPLTTYPDNSITTILTGLPDGSTLAPWDPVQGQFLPASVYSSSTGWSTNYNLPPGLGALVHSPAGAVISYSGTADYTWTPPQRAGAVFLIGAGVPWSTTFQDVVGRPPRDGEWVRTLSATNQTYRTTTFHRPTGWDNGAPEIGVEQSAFFYLTISLSLTSAPPAGVTLFWPVLSGNWVVQENAGFDPSGWADVSVKILETNGVKQVTLSRDPQATWFYRLRKE
jgi:hypothetical protein